MASVQAPANGAARPSATVFGWIGTTSPASRASDMALAPSGSTPYTRAPGRRSLTAAAIPPIRPPPPTPTTTTSTSGRSSRISSPALPWPAMTAGSSNGWQYTSPRSASSSLTRWSVSPTWAPWSTTSAP